MSLSPPCAIKHFLRHFTFMWLLSTLFSHWNCSSYLFKYTDSIFLFHGGKSPTFGTMNGVPSTPYINIYKQTTVCFLFHRHKANGSGNSITSFISARSCHKLCNCMQCCQALKLKIHSTFCFEKLNLDYNENTGFLKSHIKFKWDTTSTTNVAKPLQYTMHGNPRRGR